VDRSRTTDGLHDTPHLAGIRLLLVEDDEPLRIALEGLLRSAGAEVVSASDAEAAASHLAEGIPVDVVLTDMQLPGRDGLWLANTCAERYPGVAVILASAAVLPSGVVLPPSVRRFLRKPFDTSALTEAVARAAGRPA
jgi:two-component system response regulator GlrR